MAGRLNITKSLERFEKAKVLIPSCAQTFSKNYTQFSFGVSPIFLKKADGCHIWDVDGNEYIDYIMGIGPVILGHNHPAVLKPIREQLKNGIAFSLPHEKEVELAELLRRVVPCAEMVRYGKNGSDATAGAVRASRAFTKRDIVACCGYHGWQDWYIGTTLRSAGVPEEVRRLTKTFKYNDIESLKKIFSENRGNVACVIMEPMGVIFPEGDFLKKVADLAKNEGALLIFDECWTGFRLALGGAQEYFKIVPDMACLGKALGNGFPISVVAGRRAVMEIFDEVFYSFTFGGDALGITAGIAVINFMLKNPVIQTIKSRGLELWKGVEGLLNASGLNTYIRLTGYPARQIMEFRDREGREWWELKSLLQQEIHKRGIIFGGYHVISYSHKPSDIRKTLEIYKEVFDYVRECISKDKVRSSLKGKVVQPVFRKP